MNPPTYTGTYPSIYALRPPRLCTASTASVWLVSRYPSIPTQHATITDNQQTTPPEKKKEKEEKKKSEKSGDPGKRGGGESGKVELQLVAGRQAGRQRSVAGFCWREMLWEGGRERGGKICKGGRKNKWKLEIGGRVGG